jgi:hypothetical protein
MAVHQPQSSSPFSSSRISFASLSVSPSISFAISISERFLPRPSLQQDASRCLWQPLCAPAPWQGAIPSVLSSASYLCIRKEAWSAASSQAPASVHYAAVCIYSRRSTPLTRRSKSSAWSFASSRTLSWPKPALPLWLAASVRPKTFMPRACAMMTSFTVDMPT